MQVKAIFLDIDGTMVSFNTHCVSDETASALRMARKNGVKVFVATGRQHGDINNLGSLEFDGYISLNGGYCWVGDKVVFTKSIPREDVAAFIDYEYSLDRMIPCFFVEADRITANMEDDEISRMMELVHFEPRPIVPMRDLIDKDIYQLTAFFPIEHEPEILKLLPGCTATRWYPTFADITALGVDKSIGLQKIGEYFGINSDEMMAFGDGGNDISMIRYAGIGVAMGNAEESVKQSADYITTSVDDDGVGNALRHFGVI